MPRPPLDRKLAEWLNANTDNFFLAAISVVELETGVRQLGRKSPGKFHQQLSAWLAMILELYAKRVLPLDLRTARVASELADRAIALGRHPGTADILIAATAAAEGATLLTRNARHFAPLGVAAIDPFEILPANP
jgi:predicted nucleic acid-binding protein